MSDERITLDKALESYLQQTNILQHLKLEHSSIRFLYLVNNEIYYTSVSNLNSFKVSAAYKNGYQLSDVVRDGKYCSLIKPGRLFRKLTDDTIIDKQIEDWVHKFNTCITNINIYNIQVWPSQRIPEAYLEHNYSHIKSASLQNSCMRSKDKQPLLKFYIANNVDIVVLIDANKQIVARALLWPELTFLNRGIKQRMLDRIYYSSDNNIDIFNKFALQYGYVKRINPTFFSIKENNFEDKVCLFNVNLDDITCLPYADTMIKLYYKDKVLTNAGLSDSMCKTYGIMSPKKCLILHTTQDYIEELDSSLVFDIVTGRKIPKLDIEYSNHYKGFVNKQYLVAIEDAFESYHVNDPLVCFTFGGKYAFVKDCIKSNYCGNYLKKKDAWYVIVKINSNSSLDEYDYVHTKDIINPYKLQNGDWVLGDNYGHLECVPGYTKLYRIKSKKYRTVKNKNKQHIFTEMILLKDMPDDTIDLNTSNICHTDFCDECDYNRKDKSGKYYCMFTHKFTPVKQSD